MSRFGMDGGGDLRSSDFLLVARDRGGNARAKFLDRHPPDAFGAERTRGRVKYRERAGILRHGFTAGSRVARNSEASFNPARHGESSRGRTLQKHDGVGSRIEFGRAVHGGGQMPDAPARQANLNFRGQLSLHSFR